MASVAEATRETFDELVATGLVLVDVWGPDCRPCVALGTHVEGIAESHPELAVVKLDASKARRLCIAHQVRGLPTLLLFRDGREVARISHPGLQPAQLDRWLATELGRLHAEEE
ncbi:MAG TPA: thioredoxin family protein [Mycobacteriales bacterium]|nr:thioredoxin family protein [Mycobacteriales bacterium]